MPEKIVDLSARSRYIREEPWHLHFWENRPEEVLDFLREPRGFLTKMGIELPEECRIETVIENHDWMASNTSGLSAHDGVVVCNVGGGNVAKNVYRINMYAHHERDVGKFEKRLLHDTESEQYGA